MCIMHRICFLLASGILATANDMRFDGESQLITGEGLDDHRAHAHIKTSRCCVLGGIRSASNDHRSTLVSDSILEDLFRGLKTMHDRH